MTDRDNANADLDLLAAMPLTARAVLEIGCDNDALFNAYRARNPTVRYDTAQADAILAGDLGTLDASQIGECGGTGPEVAMGSDPPALPPAEGKTGPHKRGDRGRMAKSDEIPIPASQDDDGDAAQSATAAGAQPEKASGLRATPNGPYDLAAIGDVLIGAADPHRLLARLHGLMAPRGTLVLSVPNASHWPTLRALLEGRDIANPAGNDGDRPTRKDQCPLPAPNGFTQAQLESLITGAGFRMRRMTPRLRVDATGTAWIERLRAAARALGIDARTLADRARVARYIAVAERDGDDRPFRPPLRIHQSVLAPTMMAARTSQPAIALRAEPGVHLTETTRSFDVPPCPAAGGVLILQRPRIREPDRMADIAGRILTAGWVLIIEYDDDPALVARTLGDGEHDFYFRSMRMAHGVQTSTPRLRAMFAAHNPETAMFPNAVLALGPAPRAGDGPATVFYGALNRGDFAARVAAGLRPAIDAHPDTEFLVAHDRDFFDALPTARKQFLGALDYDDYLAALDRADIALMPLEGTEEELAKSDLKWVEAASRGTAAIVSPAVYGAVVDHGQTAMVARNLAHWPVVLTKLLAAPGRRRRLAAAAQAQVADGRMFCHQVAHRVDWYRSLIARKAELDRALAARVPELAPALAARP